MKSTACSLSIISYLLSLFDNTYGFSSGFRKNHIYLRENPHHNFLDMRRRGNKIFYKRGNEDENNALSIPFDDYLIPPPVQENGERKPIGCRGRADKIPDFEDMPYHHNINNEDLGKVQSDKLWLSAEMFMGRFFMVVAVVLFMGEFLTGKSFPAQLLSLAQIFSST